MYIRSYKFHEKRFKSEDDVKKYKSLLFWCIANMLETIPTLKFDKFDGKLKNTKLLYLHMCLYRCETKITANVQNVRCTMLVRVKIVCEDNSECTPPAHPWLTPNLASLTSFGFGWGAPQNAHLFHTHGPHKFLKLPAQSPPSHSVSERHATRVIVARSQPRCTHAYVRTVL